MADTSTIDGNAVKIPAFSGSLDAYLAATLAKPSPPALTPEQIAPAAAQE